ncbi:hypothetical protein GCM10010193_43890 [Kitasatospora atroaurantiaca]|uniref:Uncharacterized protein n=1 Tax=Kitasatospora atroaurantiaca TaxID=285545 RepID=A0A561ETK2_9ACTN|nr:hypothetical protein [Kitasatospora atroaurantiaca]TWE18942.1 hypothetical protein FB465_4043 [Kitasatospora atroaurantiaca]
MTALTTAPAARRAGSPVVEPGLQPALLTAVLCALVAGSAFAGRAGLVLMVAALQVLTAAGWFRLNGMWPARQGIALAALAGFAADLGVLVVGGPAGLIGALGGALVLGLVLQTFRPSDPSERFYALTVLGSATVASGFCAALLLAAHVPAAVLAVAATVAVAVLPLPGPVAAVAALLLGAGAGVLAGAPLAVAVPAAVGALVGRRVAGYDFPSRFVHLTAGVALPLAVAAPLVWIGSRLFTG